jgi:hypothetical protein
LKLLDTDDSSGEGKPSNREILRIIQSLSSHSKKSEIAPRELGSRELGIISDFTQINNSQIQDAWLYRNEEIKYQQKYALLTAENRFAIRAFADVKKSFEIYILLLKIGWDFDETKTRLGKQLKNLQGKEGRRVQAEQLKLKMRILDFYDDYTATIEVIFHGDVIRVYFATDPKLKLDCNDHQMKMLKEQVFNESKIDFSNIYENVNVRKPPFDCLGDYQYLALCFQTLQQPGQT